MADRLLIPRHLPFVVPALAANGRAAPSAVRCLSRLPDLVPLRHAVAMCSAAGDPIDGRPPEKPIQNDGCDFEHWLVITDPPNHDLSRDEIIDGYVNVLAQVVGSEEEARLKIYSVSTKHYFAFGCLGSEDIANKLRALPIVRWVLPDSYLDVKNKDYGGEPFINGKSSPYDPKYHEKWLRNNAVVNDRLRKKNKRPRRFDLSRTFEYQREEDVQKPRTQLKPPATLSD